MKKIFVFIILFNLVIINANAKEKVELSKCVDGDTFKIYIENKEYTVRMLAVDTPESVHPNKKVEYYGKEASDFTCNKLTNAKKIELEYDLKSDKTDKYKRLLAWVFVDDYLLQELLIEKGYAEVAYLYDDYKYTPLLQDKQAISVSSKIGIWNEENKNKWEENNKKDTKLSFKEILLLVGIGIGMYLYKQIKKKVKRINI